MSLLLGVYQQHRLGVTVAAANLDACKSERPIFATVLSFEETGLMNVDLLLCASCSQLGVEEPMSVSVSVCLPDVDDALLASCFLLLAILHPSKCVRLSLTPPTGLNRPMASTGAQSTIAPRRYIQIQIQVQVQVQSRAEQRQTQSRCNSCLE